MFAGGHSTPVSVAAGEPGLTAVGGRTFRDLATPSGGTASAWHSADGIAWEPAVADADLAVGDAVPTSGPEAGFVDVTWGTGGFVAVGIALEPPGVVGGAWRSADGRDWTRVELPDRTIARPTSVTWNGTDYVIVGVVEEEVEPRAAVWLSSDGTSWQRVADDPAFDIGGYIDTMEYHAWGGPVDVAVDSAGSLFAVGQTCTGMAPGDAPRSTTCQPVVWTSADGLAWAPSFPGETAAASRLASIAAAGGRVVAVGGSAIGSVVGVEPDESAHVLVGDGDGWRLVKPAGLPSLDRVVTLGNGFLAASTAGGVVSLWTSPDGLAWTEVPGVPQPPHVALLRAIDLVVARDRVVVVGWAELGSAAGMGGFAITWSLV